MSARPLAPRILLLVLVAATLIAAAVAVEFRSQRTAREALGQLAELWLPTSRGLDNLSGALRTLAEAVAQEPVGSEALQGIGGRVPAARDVEAQLLQLHGRLRATEPLARDRRAYAQLLSTVDALRSQSVDVRLRMDALGRDEARVAAQLDDLSREVWVMQRRVDELRQVVAEREAGALSSPRPGYERPLSLGLLLLGLALWGLALRWAVLALRRARELHRLAEALPASREALGAVAQEPDELGMLAGALVRLVDTREERDRVLRRQHEELERAYRERLTAQRALVATERLAAIGEMSSRITHEIRNPLASMSLNVDMLREELAATPGTDPEVLEMIGAVDRELQRLNHLAEGYLRASRPATSNAVVLPPAEVVEDVLRQLQPTLEQQQVRWSVDAERDGRILADPDELRQILLNLVQNALEALARTEAQERRLALRVVADEQSVTCLVDDSGPGIDDAMRSRLFEPFASSRQDGTGLGLAICRQLVLAQGGEMEAIAKGPLGGARFRIRWPRTQTTLPSPLEESAS